MTEATVEERISARIDQGSAKEIAVRESAGGLDLTNVSQAMDIARMMAVSSIAVPKHLRGNPGACLAVVIQAAEWRLSPFQVANKSYSVNDRLAYEAQLIEAVILQRAPIKGRIRFEFKGSGESRICRAWAELADGSGIVDYESPPRGRISPQNSPLWKSDPDQQQSYYSGRALCRRHFPDVLLGIYARDELEGSPQIGPDRARDVTPSRPSLAEKLDALAAAPPEDEIDPETGEMLPSMAQISPLASPETEPPSENVAIEEAAPAAPKAKRGAKPEGEAAP